MRSRYGLIIAGFLAAFLLGPVAGLAQGIRMSPDFLPLEVGNMWRYEVIDAEGRSAGAFEMEILQHTILDGVSLYVFSRFPLGGDGGFDGPVAIRFDGDERSYIYTDGQRRGDLFPSAGARAEIMETDESGLPRVVRLSYEKRTLALERGVGVIAASEDSPDGRTIVSLIGARVGNEVIGNVSRLPEEPLYPVEEAADGVVLPSETAPVLEVDVARADSGQRFVLRVRNPTEKLMAFDFTTSQSFDFVVTDAAGREVWRWARDRFFSETLRSEAIRVGGEWQFEAEWNDEDEDLNRVPRGTYQVRGILTSTSRFESEPVAFQID